MYVPLNGWILVFRFSSRTKMLSTTWMCGSWGQKNFLQPNFLQHWEVTLHKKEDGNRHGLEDILLILPPWKRAGGSSPSCPQCRCPCSWTSTDSYLQRNFHNTKKPAAYLLVCNAFNDSNYFWMPHGSDKARLSLHQILHKTNYKFHNGDIWELKLKSACNNDSRVSLFNRTKKMWISFIE